MSAAAEREVLDIHQAAEYLGVSEDTLYRYAQGHVVPAFRLGNRWRFKRSFLDAWMAEQSYPEKGEDDGTGAFSGTAGESG
jgi:excisionase family DNA binding protein